MQTLALNLRSSRSQEICNQKQRCKRSSQIHYGPNTSKSAMITMKSKAQSQTSGFR
jgi:hypothetical protein